MRQAHAALGKEFGMSDYRAVGAAIVLARCLAGEDRKSEALTVLDETRQKLAEQPPEKSTALLDRVEKARAGLSGPPSR